METNTHEYWLDYHNRLDCFIDYYKKKLSNPNDQEMEIDFNYHVEFYSEKVASLYSELDRVKTILSILRYTYETDEIQ